MWNIWLHWCLILFLKWTPFIKKNHFHCKLFYNTHVKQNFREIIGVHSWQVLLNSINYCFAMFTMILHALKIKFLNSMTFQVFHDLHEPCNDDKFLLGVKMISFVQQQIYFTYKSLSRLVLDKKRSIERFRLTYMANHR